ncbi:MAG: ABC transporter ATP-binding protein [Myxococcota bacterium]
MTDGSIADSVGWRFARAYGLRYAWWYVGGVIALFATNGLAVSIPVHLARGIDALGDPGGHPTVVRAAATVAGMGVAVILIRTASRLLFFTPGRLVETQLMRDVFARAIEQQPDFYAKFSAGDLTSRLTSDVTMARLMFGFTALGLVNTAVAVVVAGVQLVSLATALGLVVALPLLGAFLLTTRAVDRLRAYQRRYQEQLTAVSDHTLASFQGVAAIHAFGAAPALIERFRVLNHALLATQVARSGLRVAIGPLLGLAAALDVFLVLWFGVGLTAGEIVAFTAIVGYLVSPLRQLTFTLSVVRQATVSFERLDAVLSAVPTRPELPHPAPAPTGPPAVRVEHLTYRYPGSDRDSLRDVSFAVPAGSVLGVFGPTGSGKTTLARCLLRLCHPPAGAVFVDGVDLTTVDLDGWREIATLVPQRAFLYSERVSDNILLGRGDAATLDALIDAAQLRTDLAVLPHGVDTVVGEAGLTLSGGQRQRVALARGLHRPSALVVLDDVLSAVDPTTEAALIRALRDRPGHPTMVIVSNRVSALRHADHIVVLDRGELCAQGTHAALLARPGPYREAALRQQEGAEPAGVTL